MSKEETIRQMKPCFDTECKSSPRSDSNLGVETKQLLPQLPELRIFTEDNNQIRDPIIPTIIVEETDISTQFQKLEEGVEKLITIDGTDSGAGIANKITIR